MNEATEVMDLVVLPATEQELDAVFIEGQDLSLMLTNIRSLAVNLPTDMAKKKDRDAIAGFAYKIARAKQAVEKAGLEVAKRYKDIPKKIDATRRSYKDAFETLQAEVRAPLDAWELAEKNRVAEIQNRIDDMRELVEPIGAGDSVETIQKVLDMLSAIVIDKAVFAELETDALRTKEDARCRLEKLLIERKAKDEADAKAAAEAKAKAEAERLAREDAIRKETEERVRKQQADELARLNTEKEKALEVIRAMEAENAVQRASLILATSQEKALSETTAVAPIQVVADAEKTRVHRDAMTCLMANCGLSEADAKGVVIAIVKGKINGISIHY